VSARLIRVILGALLLNLHGARAEDAVVRIDGIEIQGVTIFRDDVIEGTLEVTVGDPAERRKVVRTAENIQGLYANRGYEQVKVTSDLTQVKTSAGKAETVLRISVDEGLPTRIASIRYSPASLRDPRHRKAWESVESEIREAVAFSDGDIFDQDKLNSGKRIAQELMASQEFIGANLDDVRVDSAVAPLSSAGLPVPLAAKWVSIELKVELGDRVTFGFRGEEVVARSRLRTLIDEQRAIGFGRDYVGAIRERIVEEYLSLGYAKIAVKAFTIEQPGRFERHVTYELIEGPKFTLERLDFEGNQIFPSDLLRREFFLRSAGVLQRRTYVDKEIEKSTELLLEWMKSQGYLASKLVAINRIFDAKRSSYRVVIYLYEGDQTILQKVEITGASSIPEREVVRILGLKETAPLNLYAFTEGLEALKSRYREMGHLDAKVANEAEDSVVRYYQENRNAEILVKIEEGPLYRCGKIDIEGATQIDEEVIRRELRFQSGDVLEESRIAETEAALRKLGVFASVSVRITDVVSEANASPREGVRDVRVTVSEGTPGVIAGGIGYRSDLGFRIFGQSSYGNLWSGNHTVLLNASANRRFDDEFCDNSFVAATVPARSDQCRLEYQIELGYIWPWFAFRDTTFRPRISYEYTQYRLFDAKSAAFAASWDRPLIRSWNTSASLTYSLERIKQEEAVSPTDNTDLTIGAIIPAVRVDLRDSSLAPTRGFFGSASFEFANSALLSQTSPQPIGYTRFQMRTDYFLPVIRNVTWYFSARGGFERNLEPPPPGLSLQEQQRYQIPLSKQFALGGTGSIRGYGEQEINVTDAFFITGTLAYVNFRTQLDLPFSGPLRFGPFLDGGNLFIDGKAKIGPMRFGSGAGFHYQSPVGPVNFDIGFKLFPKPGETERYRFYFSIGVI